MSRTILSILFIMSLISLDTNASNLEIKEDNTIFQKQINGWKGIFINVIVFLYI